MRGKKASFIDLLIAVVQRAEDLLLLVTAIIRTSYTAHPNGLWHLYIICLQTINFIHRHNKWVASMQAHLDSNEKGYSSFCMSLHIQPGYGCKRNLFSTGKLWSGFDSNDELSLHVNLQMGVGKGGWRGDSILFSRDKLGGIFKNIKIHCIQTFNGVKINQLQCIPMPPRLCNHTYY